MKVWTSYFAKANSLPADIVPIAICRYRPRWFTGRWYPTIAPTGSLLQHYKTTGDTNYYTEQFNSQLAQLSAEKIVATLAEMSQGRDVALLCYERPSDFCHRHLVADWLNSHGYPCEEYKFN